MATMASATLLAHSLADSFSLLFGIAVTFARSRQQPLFTTLNYFVAAIAESLAARGQKVRQALDGILCPTPCAPGVDRAHCEHDWAGDGHHVQQGWC